MSHKSRKGYDPRTKKPKPAATKPAPVEELRKAPPGDFDPHLLDKVSPETRADMEKAFRKLTEKPQ